jgi:protein-disulfide isomerase
LTLLIVFTTVSSIIEVRRGQRMSQNQPYSLQSLVSFVNNNFVVLLLIVLSLGAGFFVGSVWTENTILKTGGSKLAAQPTAADPSVPAGDTGPTVEQLGTMPEVTEADHIRGSLDAPIVLVEYSDLECPFCARFHPTMQQVMEEYGDQVAWVYRHYPLSFHPQAQPAAEASECIARDYGNDAFWDYADMVFERVNVNGSLTRDDIFNIAGELGYDQAAVESCVDNGETTELVTAQFNAGNSAGISGTPGTIIVTADGPQALVPGALPFDQVKIMIDQYL